MTKSNLFLIIDDNEDFLEQYGTLAKLAGYDVETINDSKEALERIKNQPTPTLILLDAVMPHVSGDEVLASIRADEQWQRVPVYILTADVRAAPGLFDRLPDAPQADGILEKGANSIVQVRALLARYKK